MVKPYPSQTFCLRNDTILCFVVTFVLLWPCGLLHCIHDTVQEESVTATRVQYSHHRHASHRRHSTRRNKREDNQYAPIRIKSIFIFDFEQTQEESVLLKQVTAKALDKVASTFSVLPVKGPLLLDRKPCERVWSSGINKGKCSQKKGIQPEYCLDNMKIPKDHLKGYSLYDDTHSQPIHIEPDGTGVDKVDFVLYVTAKFTYNCQKDDSTTAYAAFCQVDQHGRPVAGHINFCPLSLRKSKEKLYWVALHEIFHALGFSKNLFNKFKKCDENGRNCKSHPTLLRVEDGILRLQTPHVTKMTQEHFQCFDKEDYGGPMDIANTSHWDSRTMQGSLMNSKSDLPHLTFIDPITLALFEDTGWYKVDYSQADVYMWGRGEGCDFGLPEYCRSQVEYFCEGEFPGCHYLHWDKATCRTYSVIKPCRVYKSEQGDECWKGSESSESNKTLEVFSRNSRCFMANISKTDGSQQDLSPKCFHAHCFDSKTLMVRVDNSSWTVCPAGELLMLPGYKGYVQCPIYPQNICSGVPRPITTTVATTSAQTTTKASVSVPYHTHNEKTTSKTVGSSSSHLCSSVHTIISIVFLNHFSSLFH